MSNSPRPLLLAALLLPLVPCFLPPARAIDIEGVLPASLDQPRIYLAVSTTRDGKPIVAKGGAAKDLQDALAGALGEKKKRDAADDAGVFAIEAFLDTGASGVMLSKPTAESLGLDSFSFNGKSVKFFDVGIGGEESFAVSQPLFLRTAPYSSSSEGDDLSRYVVASARPARIKLREEGGMMDAITGGMDVAGMPVMQGKVMLIDARPLKDFDKLKTSLLNPGDKSIPRADAVVSLTYVDFARFTRVEPANAEPVVLAPNPMVGPDPFNSQDKTPAVEIKHKGKSAKLTMLLDTGATTSILSIKRARELGIVIDENGKPDVKETFTLPIGGIGGQKDVHGLFLDAMTLPTRAGEPVRYIKVPVLLLDISVTDPKTGEPFTLDGVLGMNLFVASASMGGTGLSMGVDNIHDGAFSFITIDHANKTLGVTVKKE
jgi:hypothetical protein